MAPKMELSEKDLRIWIKELHTRENAMNKEMGKISAEIKRLEKKKSKLASSISKNMKYRNDLIKKL